MSSPTSQSSRTASLVLLPTLSYRELASKLTEAGWVEQPSTLKAAPLIPGEPEAASWRKDEVLLTYTFQPVVSLRLLNSSRLDCLMELEGRLPVLEPSELETLLTSSDTRSLMLGLLASGVTHQLSSLPRIKELLEHPDPRVAKAAAHARQKIGEAVWALGQQRLEQEKAEHPERSVLFPRIGGPAARLNALQSIPRFGPPSQETLSLLEAGLEDPDWEIRAAAVILAARLDARHLAPKIRQVKFHDTGTPRPPKQDRPALLAFRKMTVKLLTGQELPSDPVTQSILHALLGSEQRHPDALWALAHSLAGSVTVHEDEPKIVGNLTFHRVPPGKYLTGGGEDHQLAWSETEGFWISDPILDASGSPRRFTDEEKNAALVELQLESKQVLRLPSPTEWEIALRGPAGRHYPWGNSIIRLRDARQTGWSGAPVWPAALPEWTSEDILAGSAHDPACSARTTREADGKYPFRVILG